MDFSHVSVLLKETVGNLITDPNGIYVDGTLASECRAELGFSARRQQ